MRARLIISLPGRYRLVKGAPAIESQGSSNHMTSSAPPFSFTGIIR
jgi:hypothetical protein